MKDSPASQIFSVEVAMEIFLKLIPFIKKQNHFAIYYLVPDFETSLSFFHFCNKKVINIRKYYFQTLERMQPTYKNTYSKIVTGLVGP